MRGDFCMDFLEYEGSELSLMRRIEYSTAARTAIIETLRYTQGEAQCIFQMPQFTEMRGGIQREPPGGSWDTSNLGGLRADGPSLNSQFR